MAQGFEQVGAPEAMRRWYIQLPQVTHWHTRMRVPIESVFQRREFGFALKPAPTAR